MSNPSFTPSVPVTRSTIAGPVTRQMVRARTRELAVLAGRAPLQVTQADYAQARRELTGESEPSRQDAVLDGRHRC